MTAKKLTIAAAILAGITLAATTASLAQIYDGGTQRHYAQGRGLPNDGGSLRGADRAEFHLMFVDCLESGAAESCGNGSYGR